MLWCSRREWALDSPTTAKNVHANGEEAGCPHAAAAQHQQSNVPRMSIPTAHAVDRDAEGVGVWLHMKHLAHFVLFQAVQILRFSYLPRSHWLSSPSSPCLLAPFLRPET
uniref:Uncharacterized protein n=1 Tax=Eutreptiella gymnastica TaxID=73025 RepID=A0A7S1IA00_9EUGL